MQIILHVSYIDRNFVAVKRYVHSLLIVAAVLAGAFARRRLVMMRWRLARARLCAGEIYNLQFTFLVFQVGRKES